MDKHIIFDSRRNADLDRWRAGLTGERENAKCYMHAWGLTQDSGRKNNIQEASNVCRAKRESKKKKQIRLGSDEGEVGRYHIRRRRILQEQVKYRRR